MAAPVYAIILAGGSGTRFWPASRKRRPKQLLALVASGETLIGAAVRRLDPVVPPERVWVATSANLLDATVAALPQVPRSHFLAEPVARNTAACIGWATSAIMRSEPDAVVAVLPADHHIGDEPAFRDVLARALGAAAQGWLTTIGIVPTRPETGYGYIEVGEPIAEGVNATARFVEKPDRRRAEEFVAGRRHLWNAGMFFYRARAMRDAMAKHLPALGAALDRLDAAAARGEEASALLEVFPALPSISIDHGVMERADRIAVVPGSFGWNDVGSWEVTWEMASHDGDDNVVPGRTIAIDATRNLVRDLSRGAAAKRWALVGVHDLVIVETDDAVLVVPRARAQDVRAVVEALEKSGDAEWT